MKCLGLLLALLSVFIAGLTAHGAEQSGGKANAEADPEDELTALIECRTPLADVKTVLERVFESIKRANDIQPRSTRSNVVGPDAVLVKGPKGMHAYGREGQRLLIVADNSQTEPVADLQRTMRTPGPGLAIDTGYSPSIRNASGIFMEVDEAPTRLTEALGFAPLSNEANLTWYRRRMNEEREKNALGDRAVLWVHRMVGHVFELPERPHKAYVGCEYRFEGWIQDTKQP